MKIVISILISYIALYFVIYLHEIGHAIFYYKYGCKNKWWHVTVKPYLFFSTPMPINIEKIKLLSKKQNIFIASGGIIVNLVFAFVTFIMLRNINKNYYISLFLYQFLTLHLAEVISYLVIGNIYLVSDMKLIAKSKSVLRVIYFIFGLFIGIIYLFFLIHIPQQYKLIVFLFNIITIVCMSIGRIIFTAIHKRLN